jgi:hypothetical protein
MRVLGMLAVRVAMLGAALLAGCNESLFGAHHGGHAAPPPDTDTVPAVCTPPCLADAGAEFDGTAGGMRAHWRYLDDDRAQRNWQPMTVGSGEMIGQGQNRITSCTVHPEAAACAALPGALLVTSTGATAPTDPAIEFKAPTSQVIQLTLHAFLAAGDNQTIRLYRNSRDDVLFTGIAMAGTPVAHDITVDALPGDRFLVAVAPTGNGAADIGLQLFIAAAPTAFPSSCKLTLRFDEIASGNSVTDVLCAKDAFTHFKTTGTTAAVVLAPAPFTELGSSGVVENTTFLHELAGMPAFDYARDVTVQMWVNLRSFVNAGRASVFSDLGPTGGGVEIAVVPGPPDTITVTTRTAASSLVMATGMYPAAMSWHLVRVVRTATGLRLCVDGAPAAVMDTTPILAPATHLPDFGKDLQAAMNQASFDGELDDVRVITSALPCE